MSDKHAAGDEFDERLKRAAQGLAAEPLPDGIIDRDLSTRPTLPSIGLPAIAVLLVVAAVIAASRLWVTPPVGVAAPSPEPSVSETLPLSATAPESTLPPGSVTPGDFVKGPYGCGDGIGGFIVYIPQGWYANSAHDGIPACRFVSTEQFVVNDLDDPPSVPITLSVETGAYQSTGTLIERSEPTIGTIEGGLPALRLVEAVENGRRLVYVIGLDGSLPSEGSPDRYLLAMTMFGDSTYGRDSAALDEMFARFGIPQDPYVHDEAAAAQADSLFAQTLTCTKTDLNFDVDYPATWFTNPVTPELAPCSWFGPSEFVAADPNNPPDNAVVTMTVFHGGVAVNAYSFYFDSRNVGSRPSILTEGYGGLPWEPDTNLHTYDYRVAFGDNYVSGPNLVATTDTAVNFDYEVAKEVLDRMMASLTLID